MAIKLGKAKDRQKITLKDFRSSPIWMQPYGEYGETERPVLARDPDVTSEILKQCYAPVVFCTVRDHPYLFAQGWYSKKERHLSMLRFWQDGRWVGVKELKAPRPLTLVAVPKIEGKAGVEFFLLTRYDSAAPGVGGTLRRFAGPDKFKHQKLARGMVPARIKMKPRPASRESGKRSGPLRLAGAKLGPQVDAGKITIKDRIKHPVWVSTYEEDVADENAQRAVISRDPNASAEVIRKFLEPTLTFRVSGTDVYGTASYDREADALESFQFWTGKRWDRQPGNLKGVSWPLTLEPLCRILGKRDARFTLNKAGDRTAQRARP